MLKQRSRQNLQPHQNSSTEIALVAVTVVIAVSAATLAISKRHNRHTSQKNL